MRKQESVHLHALLLAVARHLEERGETPPVDRSPYHDLEVGPSSVHRAKETHEEAVLVLSRAIQRSLDQSAEPPAR